MKCLGCGHEFPSSLIAKQPPHCYACCFGSNREARRRLRGGLRVRVEMARQIQLKQEKKNDEELVKKMEKDGK